MKKKLEAELISIAHRILQLKDTTTTAQLQNEARQLYEKLSILSFAESHFSEPQPTIGQIKAVLEEEIIPEIKKDEPKIVAKEIEYNEPKINVIPEESPTEVQIEPEKEEKETITVIETNTDVESKNTENRPELIIEEINAKVSEDLFVPASSIPEETTAITIEANTEKDQKKNNTNTANEASLFAPLPDKINNPENKPKSLNDQLKKGIHIGLNDRLAFIKHLFDGSSTDYNRVLSQLNTLNSKNEAQQFINQMVKPDYNNWQGKKEYEERFISIVSNKFEH